MFNSIEGVQREKKSNLKLNDFERRQFLFRKTIIKATTLKEKNFNYKIAGKETKINDVYTYIQNNSLCIMGTNKDTNDILTLSLSNPQKNKLNNNDLQNIYSEVF